MIEMTPEARARYEGYLRRIRESLRGRRAAEADEVEQNVREHIEIALAATPAPVGADRLVPVLEQLGPPEAWVPAEERPMWRQAMERLMEGPEDWRLPYVSFALTTLMFLLLPVGGILLLAPAFIVSRAWFALIEQRGETAGARRWLVMPPIVIVFVFFVLLMLIGPIILAGAAAVEHDLSALGIPRPDYTRDAILGFSSYILFAAGTWWLLLAALMTVLLAPVRALFAPLLANVRRRHLLLFVVAAAVCLASGAGLWWLR